MSGISEQQQFEAFIQSQPEARALYAEFGVKNYEDYLRVQSQMETRLQLAGIEKCEPVQVDPDAWMTEALKRSAAVEEELRSSMLR